MRKLFVFAATVLALFGARQAQAEGKWKEVGIDELEAAIKSGKAHVYDNNPKFLWEEKRIPGAILLNAAKYEAKDLPEDKGAMLVFYCANPKCHSCHNGADRAVGFGYTNVYIFPLGIEGWEKAGKPTAPDTNWAPEEETGVLSQTMKDIDGKDVKLSSYKGKVVMIVNVASKCGLTPQYNDLEAAHEKYGKDGLVILGFPANEFGGQEPGTDPDIKTFCTSKFGVKFPMFSKIVVKGDSIHPLYKWLTDEKTNPGFSGDIKWNFTKFLVSREGKVVKRIEPKTAITEKEVVKALEEELAKQAPK